MQASVVDLVLDLLEDFDVVGTHLHAALVRRSDVAGVFGKNVRVAAVASTLRLASLDHARRRYVEGREPEPQVGRHEAYVNAYHAAKNYMHDALGRLRTHGRPEPSVGVFGASIVLERLTGSFFCAHLLYRLGRKYEGHAVARLILEQLAWSYAAHEHDDLVAVERVSTTHSITELRQFLPSAGRLYGFLSAKTHLDYGSHHEFLAHEDGQNVVYHAQGDFREFAEVILTLADYFVLVWEATQVDYIDDFRAICPPSGAPLMPDPDRPFLKAMESELKNMPPSSTRSSGA